jgi:hypothetical protein
MKQGKIYTSMSSLWTLRIMTDNGSFQGITDSTVQHVHDYYKLPTGFTSPTPCHSILYTARGERGSLWGNHLGRHFVSGTIGALGVSRLGFTLILIALHSVNQVGTISIPHKHCSTKSLTVIVSITAEEGTVGWTVPDIMNKIRFGSRTTSEKERW